MPAGGAPQPGVRVRGDAERCWQGMRRTAVLGAKRAAAAAPLLRAQLRGTAGHAMATIPPPQGLLRPLAVPQRLLLGPGPSNVPPRILAAGGRQLLGHMHPEMLQVRRPHPRLPHPVGGQDEG